MSNTLATVPPEILTAYRAAESKKATDLKVLDLRDISSFTDYFLICSGSNPRQNHAISDEVGKQLAEIDEKPYVTEGYQAAGWILMDYGNFIVHIFSDESRAYYDLERLWGMAKEMHVPAETTAIA